MSEKILQVDNLDEKSVQTIFYEELFGENWQEKIFVDRNTDGHSRGVLFEHKLNLNSVGKAKALSQALIYLSRFNRDGIPVPRYTCLVDHFTGTCYVYDNLYYLDYINNVEKYAAAKASKGIEDFLSINSDSLVKELDYYLGEENTFTIETAEYLENLDNQYVKVDINSYNVYGWSRYYYSHCAKSKCRKIKFFEELRNPTTVLKGFINPWTGNENDFELIMDTLNDPNEQKRIGAFYTPMEYARQACELVVKAIQRVPEGNDYIILDRCAGTGNLEYYLNDIEFNNKNNDDILSHVIVSSPELKEWQVLKARLGHRVRHILPEIKDGELPEISENGYLIGSNALDEDFLNNKIIKQYVDDPKCTIILFENPPYVAQNNSITTQTAEIRRDVNEWKNSYVTELFKEEVRNSDDMPSTATNDLCNSFIWSGFKNYLRQPTDSYIVFAPPKYWKFHGLAKKRAIKGYGFNRQFFHASPELISCILWSNEDSNDETITLKLYDIEEYKAVPHKGEDKIELRKIHSIPSDKDCELYDRRRFADDKTNGILIHTDGLEESVYEKKVDITENNPLENNNIICYLISKGSPLGNPGLNSNLLIRCRYDAHGCYLRKDNFDFYLPTFAASNLKNNIKDWTITAYGNSADGYAQYKFDYDKGINRNFIAKTLIWCCMTPYAHMMSQHGRNGKLYINELCFDGNTEARKKLDELIKNGYRLTDTDKQLFDVYNQLLEMVKKTEEYESWYTYGTYQISQDINIKEYVNGDEENSSYKYGDINQAIKNLKTLTQKYYETELFEDLKKYQFIK